jgi:L-aspartate oxidase
MAMAYRAGALLEDMEFVQFHPTALYLPSSPPFLLSEAIRGEGGRLRNVKGELFMGRYHSAAELAPRDIVARAIWSERAATRSRHVYLDATHLSATFIKQRFPTIYSTCLRYDIDITEEWIPVSPSAHYHMGGVHTDTDGASSLHGLFAAHHSAHASLPSVQDLDGGPLGQLDDAEKLRSSLRRVMWGKVGLIRTGDSLVRAIAQLSRWERLASRPFKMRRDLEVKNLVQVARCIAEAALWRENSVGAHYRADYPEVGDRGWKQHSCSIRIMDSGNLKAPPDAATSERQTGGSKKAGQSDARRTAGRSGALS